MYEVETKIELTKDEKDQLLERFGRLGFIFKKSTPQHDVYIKAVKSPFYELNIGAPYEVTRYRHEGDDYIYTEKSWEMLDGKPAQKENERSVTKEEFETEIIKYPEAITIRKVRDWFEGSFEGTPISLTIDAVKFDHSPGIRFFMEAEIAVETAEEVVPTRQLIEIFLKDVLKKDEIIHAEGMFTMAFEKK